MKWVKHDGYDEEHQYVNNAGRIDGFVRGSQFQPKAGWTAFTDLTERIRLGCYISIEQAKKAVESAVQSKEAYAHDS